MARRVFFSFHYVPDVTRAQVVRQSWVTRADRDEAGFFDASVFEGRKRTGDDTLKRFLDDGMIGSSVTCSLAGTETAGRRWVRYELLRSFQEGRGIMNIAVHGIANLQRQTAAPGTNPLSELGGEIRNGTLFFKERNAGRWEWSADVKSMPASSVAYAMGGLTDFTFERIFRSYDWVGGRGYDNLGTWVEAAAKAAGR